MDQGTVSLKKATAINAFSKYSVVILGLLFSALLARLLTPEDYGVVAVVTVFNNFFILFSDMGIGAAVIQNKSLTKMDENRIFTFSICLGLLLGVLFSLFSILVLTRIYEDSAYGPIGIILGITLFFRAANMVPNAYLMKNKMFKANALRTIITCIIGYMFAVILAYAGAAYYAILAQSLVSAVIVFFWNLKCTKSSVDFHKIKDSVLKVWGYSVYQFGFTFVNYFSRNLDNLLTGYFFGDAALGYYDKAYKLMRYPVENLTNVITPSMQPILSDHQNDVKYVLRKYNKIVKLLAVISVYIGCLCFFASKEIIILYFGAKWEGAVIAFQYLSAALAFQIVGGISGSIYQSVNRTKEMFWSGIIGSIITVLGILAGIVGGSIESLALCYSIGFIVNFAKSQFFLAYFCFDESVWKLTKIFLPEAIIAAAIIFVMLFVPTLDNLLLSLLLKGSISFLVYAVMLAITKEYKIFLSLIPKKIKNRFAKR